MIVLNIMKGGVSVNIRKNTDYSTMYAQLDNARQAELPQMGRYFAIGQAVAERSEKRTAFMRC